MINLEQYIGKPAMFEQLAEECVELSHACLKYARMIRNENMTYSDKDDILENIHEEIADVQVCAKMLESYDDDIQTYKIAQYIEYKLKRMEERLKTDGQLKKED